MYFKCILFMISCSFLIVGCGNQMEVTVSAPKDGVGCFSAQTATGTLLTCSNGTTFIPNPADGQNGYNALINVIPSAPSCPNGGITIISGTDSNYDNLLTSVDYNLMTATVCNGIDGITPPFSAVSTVAPCGNTVPWKEQLLCLGNGKLLASFSDNISGYNTRLAFIDPGTYMDTDGSNCVFTVSNTASGTLVSWNGGNELCQKMKN